MQLSSALAGRTDEHNCKPLVIGHRHESGFAVSRNSLDTDFFRIDCFIRLQVVETAGGAPGPGAKRSPIVRLAPLSFIDETDDSFRESFAVVRLNTAGVDRGIAPSVRDQLLLRRRIAA